MKNRAGYGRKIKFVRSLTTQVALEQTLELIYKSHPHFIVILLLPIVFHVFHRKSDKIYIISVLYGTLSVITVSTLEKS